MVTTACLLLLSTFSFSSEHISDSPLIPVGVAKIDITPDGPIRLCGYGGRKTESEGVAGKLWAKALAFGSDEQGPSLLITVELIGAPASITEPLAEQLRKKAGIDRAHLSVCATHTHTGPCLSGILLAAHFGEDVPQDQVDRIDRYTTQLIKRLEQVALEALANRQPARLAWAEGKASFAVNRRQIKNGRWVGMGPNFDGPVDHALPMLCATDADGTLRAVLVNYACHCTTYGGGFNQIHGDWAGAAAAIIEQEYSGAIVMVAIGCGGDANPNPRNVMRGSGLVNRHGRAVADEVKRLLAGPLHPLSSPPTGRFRRIDLPLDHVPTRAELKKRLKGGRHQATYARILLGRLDRGEELPASFSYPIQTWRFGNDLTMVFLAGEVVVDYSLRLKRELNSEHLWINAYANDAPCYIASRRVIREGGYEVEQSMGSYDKPTRLSLDVEDLIIDTVKELLPPAALAKNNSIVPAAEGFGK